MKYIWVTYRDNCSPRYGGKTHSVPIETIVDPPTGTPVTILYWSRDNIILEPWQKEVLETIIAPSKAITPR